jgi:hypothetical protein
MAHFAQLDNENKVIQVIVISNDETHNSDGLEVEALGIEFCKKLFGQDTKWVQTSFNGSIRGSYAGIGDTYDVELDEFIPWIRGEVIEITDEMRIKWKQGAVTND